MKQNRKDMCFDLARKNLSENKRDGFSEPQAAQMLDSKLFFLRNNLLTQPQR